MIYHYQDGIILHQGNVIDVLKGMPAESIQCCVTSPPYWGLRSYLPDGHPDKRHEIGLEPTPDLFVQHIVEVFREARRVLRDDGVLWLNLGDSYASAPKGNPGALSDGLTNQGRNAQQANAHRTRSTIVDGLKPKDLCGIPWRVAFALQADGWWLRSDIIWAKGISYGYHDTKCPDCGKKHRTRYSGTAMPESIRDRPSKGHEYIFLLTKSKQYYYDYAGVQEIAVGGTPGNKTHKGRTAYENGVTEMRTKVGLTQMGPSKKRNLRTVWAINPKPYKGAHFATFPPALVEPMIRAGTSERGKCIKCGAPWRRVIRQIAARSKKCPKTDASFQSRGGCGEKKTGTIGMSGSGRIYGETITLGWRPTCSCLGPPWPLGNRSVEPEDLDQALSILEQYEPIETSPCKVLDPFVGSGTTLAEARRLGLWGHGIDLNGDYLELAMGRIWPGEEQ